MSAVSTVSTDVSCACGLIEQNRFKTASTGPEDAEGEGAFFGATGVAPMEVMALV